MSFLACNDYCELLFPVKQNEILTIKLSTSANLNRFELITVARNSVFQSRHHIRFAHAPYFTVDTLGQFTQRFGENAFRFVSALTATLSTVQEIKQMTTFDNIGRKYYYHSLKSPNRNFL